MKLFHKYTALALALVMGGALTGCMEDEGYIAEEDLPYGATMKEMRTSFSVPMSYDRRFINEEQAAVIADYHAGIQNQDAELYIQSTFDFYIDYQLNEMFADLYKSREEYVDGLHLSMSQQSGEDFKFNMITVSGMTEERVASRLDEMLNMLQDLSGDENFKDSVDSCYAITLEWSVAYNDGAQYLNAKDQKLFLIEIDGRYYCVK